MIDQYPYAPPSVVSPLKITYSDNAKKASASVIRDIVFSWEKLRLIFNLILFIPFALCVAANMIAHNFDPLKATLAVVHFILLFNCLYLTLPILETYLCALTQKSSMKSLRKILFATAITAASSALLLVGYQTLTI